MKNLLSTTRNFDPHWWMEKKSNQLTFLNRMACGDATIFVKVVFIQRHLASLNQLVPGSSPGGRISGRFCESLICREFDWQIC